MQPHRYSHEPRNILSEDLICLYFLFRWISCPSALLGPLFSPVQTTSLDYDCQGHRQEHGNCKHPEAPTYTSSIGQRLLHCNTNTRTNASYEVVGCLNRSGRLGVEVGQKGPAELTAAGKWSLEVEMLRGG
jgi:hypothetical protein